MKILLAGGFLGKSLREQFSLQPSPEAVLLKELHELGQDVTGIGLKAWSTFWHTRADVLHVHHMSKMAVVAAALRRRVVFTQHGGVYATSGLRGLAERLVWRRVAAVVCLSSAEEAEKLRLFPHLRGRTWVIPNGTVPVAVADSVRSWQPGSEFVIATVGQLIELKRVDLAIRTLASLPPFFVLELTYHNDELVGELGELARSLGVENRVRFLGRASGEALAERYRRAHLLLLTSRTESLPSVVTEALMAGLPVVATDVGAVADQVGTAGICVRLEDSRYLGAIDEVVDRYAHYAANALNRGKELMKHSPAKMAAMHLELYRTIGRRGR